MAKQNRGPRSCFDDSSDTDEAEAPLLACKDSAHSARSAAVEGDLQKARQRVEKLSQARQISVDCSSPLDNAGQTSHGRTSGYREPSSTAASRKHSASLSILSSSSGQTLTSGKDAQHASVRTSDRSVPTVNSRMSAATSPATSICASPMDAATELPVQKPAPYVFRKPTPIRGPVQQTLRAVFSEVGNAVRQPSPSGEVEEVSNRQQPNPWRRGKGTRSNTPVGGGAQRSYGQSGWSNKWKRGGSRAYSAPHERKAQYRHRAMQRPGLKPASVGIRKDESRQTKLKLTPSSQVSSSQQRLSTAQRAFMGSSSDPHVISEGLSSMTELDHPVMASSRSSSRSVACLPTHESSTFDARDGTSASGPALRGGQLHANRERTTSSTSLQDIVHKAAASEFRWQPPLSALRPIEHEAYAGPSQSQRRSQHYNRVFDKDPASCLKNSKDRLAEYEWNTTSSAKRLSSASTRRSLPATPQLGSSSKRRRGMFDPAAVMSYSSSIHARGDPAGASWGGKYTHRGKGGPGDELMLGTDNDNDYDFGDVRDQDLIDLADTFD